MVKIYKWIRDKLDVVDWGYYAPLIITYVFPIIFLYAQYEINKNNNVVTEMRVIIDSIVQENAGETTYSKALLALTAIGIDAEKLYPEDSETAVSAIAGLNAVEHGSSAWVAPYTLAAYNQNDYGNTEEYETAIITAVLANQKDDGSWNEWDDSIQTTSNMIAGLAFYQDREDVSAAIDKAVTYLSGVQKEDGRLLWW